MRRQRSKGRGYQMTYTKEQHGGKDTNNQNTKIQEKNRFVRKKGKIQGQLIISGRGDTITDS